MAPRLTPERNLTDTVFDTHLSLRTYIWYDGLRSFVARELVESICLAAEPLILGVNVFFAITGVVLLARWN